MYHPHQRPRKEQMWFLPVRVFSLAREKHTQILDDTGIVSEQSGPTVNSILRMPPTTCTGSRLDKRDGRRAPCSLRSGTEVKEINTV